ncbi:MAG: hypothetical protein DI586_11050 [Micavibrio aeruginosavorus]|uniref:Uncharacterized protein n=1 Tax=Micavibrio aeruginosavorus TaxID=349221 RepID=A0A2W5FBH5_9BACT|nr:MAG: hypothetical protein DI586_11050 [Micavibrio aeruginosavorus]
MTQKDIEHFNKAPVRQAKFITPPNALKQKIGSGGVSDDVISQAQGLLDNNKFDFKPDGEEILNNMLMAMTKARRETSLDNTEDHIVGIMFQAMLLKTNGGMFHYDIVTKIADKLVQFLEVIEQIREPELQIVEAYYTTLRAVFISEMKGPVDAKGQQLYAALVDACTRYFEKYHQK